MFLAPEAQASMQTICQIIDDKRRLPVGRCQAADPFIFPEQNLKFGSASFYLSTFISAPFGFLLASILVRRADIKLDA